MYTNTNTTLKPNTATETNDQVETLSYNSLWQTKLSPYIFFASILLFNRVSFELKILFLVNLHVQILGSLAKCAISFLFQK